MRMSDPKHFDHILHFLQPADVHHAIPLTAQEVVRMHAKDDVPVAAGASDLQSRSGEPSLPSAASSSPQLRYYRITTYFTPLISRFGGECTGTGSKESVHKEAISLTAGAQTLPAR